MPWFFALLLCCFKPAEEREEKVKRKCTNKKAQALRKTQLYLYLFLNEFFAFIFYGKESSTQTK